MKGEFTPLNDYEKELIESMENNEFEVVSLSEGIPCQSLV